MNPTFAPPNTTLPNAAALTALTDLPASDGAIVHLSSYDDDFELVTQVGGLPAASADVVLASSAAGRVWQRRLTNSQRWLQQTAWGIDTGAAGNNENAGK